MALLVDSTFVTLTLDRDFSFPFQGKKYSLKANKPLPVPTELFLNYFGDPRSGPTMAVYKNPDNGQVHYIPDRDSECRRMITKWGVANNISGNPDDPFAHIPKFKAFSEEEDELFFVIDDPDCAKVIPHFHQRFSTTEEKLNKQQIQIETLMATLRKSGVDIPDHMVSHPSVSIPIDGED
jgi:hypothetical protein